MVCGGFCLTTHNMSEPHKIMHTYYQVNEYGFLDKTTIAHTDPKFVTADQDTVTVKEHWEDYSGGEHDSEEIYFKNKNVVIQKAIDYAEKQIARIVEQNNDLRKQMD